MDRNLLTAEQLDAATQIRARYLKQYTVSPYGRITNPGKFEGEMIYVPYFWECFLDGTADSDNPISISVTPSDLAAFPELGSIKTVWLYERSDGFVVEVR